MAKVEVDAISKTFEAAKRPPGRTHIAATLSDISLTVEDGEFLSLVGPSGCGKSTLLRIIAGLEAQDYGSVRIGGRAVDDLPAGERDVAMVFQSYALYPHMTVGENLALPLRMRRLPTVRRLPFVSSLTPRGRQQTAEIAAEVRGIADALEIGHLLDRKPGQLSGGQRQRVALGRAMVRRPAVFLMDEPLSNLDGRLRVQMRAEIGALRQRLGATVIYVTHDQVEAMTLSDRVAVMIGGQILQVAPPQALYERPASTAVAQLIGSTPISLINGTARAGGLIDIADTRLALAHGRPNGAPLTLGVRAENWSLGGAKGGLSVTGRLLGVEHLGPESLLHLASESAAKPIVVRVDPVLAQALAPGEAVRVGAPAATVLLFDEHGKRLELPKAAPARTRSVS